MSLDLPFEGPLIQGSYFLEPDELFGMKYKAIPEGWPIPLQFYTKLPIVLHPEIGKKHEIIYTGYRPVDSYIMHKYFSSLRLYPFSYPHSLHQTVFIASQSNINQFQERRPFIGMKPYLPPSLLHFDSKFENGNLDRVVVISDKEYDLYIRSDTNSKRIYSWFYFAVKNTKDKGKIKFNIVNLTDTPHLYKHGLAPVHSIDQHVWRTSCLNVEYLPSKINSLIHKKGQNKLWMLSFEFDFTDIEKNVYFAKTVPYTFSQLLRNISSLNQYVKVGTLCTSISGVNIPKLTITNFSLSKQMKKYILIIGRVNPGEPVSSYIIEGLIGFLTSEYPQAQRSRELFIYKIIPMANVEGVIIGNSSCNLAGVALHKSHSELFDIFTSDLKSIKKFAYKLQSKRRIFLFMEISGSLRNLGSFTHGPRFSRDSPKYYYSKILSELMHRYSPMSRLLPTNYEVKIKKSSLKDVLERELRIEAYTNDTSIFGYLNEKNVVSPHDSKLLCSHGFFIGEFVLKYFTLSTRDSIDRQSIRISSIVTEDLINKSDSESSDSLQSDMSENEMDVQDIITKILKNEAKTSTEFSESSSSEEDDVESKKYLIESLQEFGTLTVKIKKNKKITMKIPERRESRQSEGIIRVSTTMFKPRTTYTKNSKARKELFLSSINMSSVCMKKKGEKPLNLREKYTKVQSKCAHIKSKQSIEKPLTRCEIPRIKSHSVISSNELVKSRSKYHRFGPFPDLRAVNSFIFSLPLL